MAKVGVTLTALFLIVIGGWFVMNSLLPILDLGDSFSLTVAASAFYLYIKLEMTAEMAKLFYYLFPIIGALSFIAGIALLSKKGRVFSKVMLFVLLAVSVMALIFCFALMGCSDPNSFLGMFKDSFESGSLTDLLRPIAEPLLIFFAALFGTIFMFGKSVKEHFEE